MSQLKSVLLALALAGTPATAMAHTHLTYPPPRATGTGGFLQGDLKARPCGKGPSEPRSSNVTTLVAGQTITVTWTEDIPHRGYFRISFDRDGMDDFVDPPTPRATDYSDSVLADVLFPKDSGGSFGATHQQEITLPNTPCDNCTLQLIQFMEDKLNDSDPNNDIYYSCADIVLTADPNNPPDPDAGVNPGTDGGTPSDGGVSPGTDAGSTPVDDSGTGLPTTDAGMGGVGGTPGAGEGSDDGGCSVSASRGRSGLGLFVALLGFFFVRRRRPLASR